MAGEDRMEPLERLLNLVGLLLETPTPLTFEQIRRTLEPYHQENIDTAKRMFERDKDALRDYGVPLELRDVDVWGTEQGYVIPKDRYYLPQIAFTPEELGALLVAAQSGGENTAAERAARKFLYGADGGVLAGLAGGPLAAGSDARTGAVLATAAAAQSRRRVTFGYRNAQGITSDRDVDAFAMVFRGGHWYLVGRDRERREVRAFRVSRMISEPDDVGAGSDPPEGFAAADHVQAGPWAARAEEQARVAFAPDVAWWVDAALAGATAVAERPDGWVEFDVPMTDGAAVASIILGFGPDAEAIAPPALREEIVRRLEVASA